MELGLAAIPPPKAKNLRLGAVRHVDDPLEPPALHDGPAYGPEDEPVLAHLQEAELTARVRPYLDGEAVPVDLTRRERFQVDVIAPLRLEKINF